MIETPPGFFARLKQRKLVQWAIAYVAFAFALIQVLDVVAQRFGWPDQIEKLLILVLAVGFLVALVLAWYHGERGAQKASGTEIVILALLLAIGGGLLWRFERATPITSGPDAAVDATSSKPRSATPAFATHGSPQTTPIPAKSVAVLPFVNMSGDAKNDYFSDGITEEILDALAQVPNLKVAARTSAFAFKGKAEDLRKVGEVLDVATVLEGSVQKSGDEVRITAQLIDTRSGYHLWSEKYDRKLTSIFAVEDEISNAIADKLKVQLAGGSGQSLVEQKAVDPHAHDFYLRGLTLLAARSVSEAVDAFQQAVAVDPDYAQAWAALAEAQALLPSYAPVSADAANTHALAAAQRALTLNASIALAYVAQGMVYTNQMRWADADRAFRRALALAPGDAEAMNQYAQFLFGAGQLEPALAEIERALQRDPLSGTHGAIRAELLLALHRDDAAVKQIESTLATHPGGLLEHRMAMWIYLRLHRYPEAEQQMRMGNVDRPDMAVLLIRGIVDPRLRASSVEALETSPELADIRDDAILYAGFLAELGENDRALAVLEGLATGANSTTPQILWYPLFDRIRNTPRFKAVLKKMDLPYTPATGVAP
ncbi:tetratricopeptide repeat protein [Rhodanobacter sp. B2A1Ga4]|uniref:tetratricopeptide repeat protein n=1 Tax=Rhodanobacter sp. B2A1Ga4 TaxID=2778647 RepID=UPI001B38F29E|nr:tetratricopeptide repeat protein [Rhodanobacter sp. B2A1Ga4]